MAIMTSVGEAATRKGMQPQGIREAIPVSRLQGYRSGEVCLVNAECLAQYQPIGRRPNKVPPSP